MATIDGRIRVVSVHLDTSPRHRQQAAALADFLPRDLPMIIGGDLNAWWGKHDQSVHEIDHVVPRVRNCGGATFHFAFLPLRLDHFFTTLPHTRCFVSHDRFGSDHHPIVLHLF